MYRLDDIDCVSARSHAALGGTLAIQAVWRYERAVDVARLREFHAALCRGRLGRVVAPAMIAAAGDRWSARARFAPLEVAAEPIRRDELEQWIAERGRAELRTYGGPAWRLAAVGLDDGGSAVSLVVSHTLVDGRGLCAAITAAIAAEYCEFDYPSDEFGPMRALWADLGAAAGKIGPIAQAVALGTRVALARRAEARGGVGGDPEFRLPVVEVTVPAQLWHAAAQARNGTGTTLAAAVMADLATEIGRVDEQGHVRMMMPVSTRTDGDERANALGSIDFEFDGDTTDLAPLRAQMKLKLAAVAGQPVPPLIPIAVALPRGLYGALARQSATDPTRTVCSHLGKLEPEILDIDGTPASSIAFGLANQSLNARAVVAARGGDLYGLFSEVAGQVTMRIKGFHPPALERADQLTDLLGRVLARYELTATVR
ncbi:hypothetical protein NDR87_13415 [Nocardia sp. CDC159]|uniref:Uncharacterized protein n=1 Tax=Nocardia pulmonis TaxID=2951408 RepID=A0A9X2E6J2_9NOCA|nr:MULTISPECIES: hypothetical protein [Nocardia]MCM6774576.1 hypothetical protein [Nocardia pulmonis]MCM6787359.1 hypothetical protein [Nocardia sp. CDC159]